MPDYDFYRDAYLGTAIPQGQFPQLINRAAEALGKLKRLYRVEGGEQAQAMALCAMAECLLCQQGRDPGVQAAAVGGVSVRYESPRSRQAARQKQLYSAAGIYLDIYRGVSNA